MRVAFLLNPTKKWLGGVQYYKNLVQALVVHRDLGIEPVIITRPDAEFSLFKEYPAIDFLHKTMEEPVESFCQAHRIDILSHVPVSCTAINYPKTGWIPDFQHRHLPHLFSKEEIDVRNRDFQVLAEKCDTVIVSSHAAKRDFCEMFPHFEAKAEVLHFVVAPFEIESTKENRKHILKDRYGIEGDFFYLPNQFWTHKNHKLVLEALLFLKKKGKEFTVVSTGNTADYRDFQYYPTLKRWIVENHLEASFKILDVIPYEDVQNLLEECCALINPSLFEGWSTTVEEAKIRGKRMLLSDIVVHHEQAEGTAHFFSPYDAEELARIMEKVIENKSSYKIEKKYDPVTMQRECAEGYAAILLRALKRWRRKE